METCIKNMNTYENRVQRVKSIKLRGGFICYLAGVRDYLGEYLFGGKQKTTVELIQPAQRKKQMFLFKHTTLRFLTLVSEMLGNFVAHFFGRFQGHSWETSRSVLGCF